MFIEQGIKPENKFWKYLIGSFLIALGSIVGQIPFSIAVFLKAFGDGKKFPTDSEAMMKVLDSNLTLFLVLFTFIGGLAAIYLVIKKIHHQTLLSVTTSRAKVDWKRVFFSFTIWGIFTIITTFYQYFTSPESFVLNFKPVPFLILFVIATLMLPLQTSCEEYVFRGYLMQGFANLSLNKWFPLVMTSMLFGLMHITNPEVEKMGYLLLVYYIGTGFLLGIMTLMDEGMELALGFHAANNLFGALLVTSDWTVFQTHSIFKDVSKPSVGFEIFIPVLVIFPFLIFIFSKKYKWTNWRDKLSGKIHNTMLIQEIEKIGNHD